MPLTARGGSVASSTVCITTGYRLPNHLAAEQFGRLRISRSVFQYTRLGMRLTLVQAPAQEVATWK